MTREGNAEKRTVLVTGGTRGLGLAIAERLSRDGYRVVATGRHLSANLDALTRDAKTWDGEIVYRPLELANRESLHDFVTSIQRTYGGLYGLINNAAVAHEGVLATQHESHIIELLTVNVTNTILLTKYAVRPMLLARCGRVVNVASIIASTGYKGLSVYAASKAALIGFTKSLAREVGRFGITVNAVAPGYMATAMSAGLDDEQLTAIQRRTPLGRLVSVQEVAGAVAFLCSSEAGSITGSTVTVDAGCTA